MLSNEKVYINYIFLQSWQKQTPIDVYLATIGHMC
jgi:hypothetical protein